MVDASNILRSVGLSRNQQETIFEVRATEVWAYDDRAQALL